MAARYREDKKDSTGFDMDDIRERVGRAFTLAEQEQALLGT